MGKNNIGPFAYENWKMAIAGAQLQTVQEYPLFTDAHIVGEVREGYGPYQLLNTVPIPPDAQRLVPAIILRVESYLDYEPTPMDETDTGRYHGGLLSDEIAALVSLCLGTRLRAGGISRYFEPDGDPRCRPRGPLAHLEPVLTKTARRSPTLPRALGQHSLAETGLIGKLPTLSPPEAIALVRAARLYQDAMWIGESAPELSWIMFVSTVEIAASHWHASQHTGVEILAEFKPELVEQLEAVGGEKTVRAVADGFAGYLRAAKKFRDFILAFMPEPPKERPKHARISWKPRDMKQAMVKIYDWRSRALHGGTLFPQPMCEPPMHLEEKPPGLATKTRGAVWLAKDTPMLLHTFEYVVQKALLK